MSEGKSIAGSIVALVTPMRDDNSIDMQALAELVEWHIEAGTDGIVAVGTTGESPTLDVEEHQNLIAETVRLVNGRIAVIAGTGANSTAEAIDLTRQACSDGADACLSVVPYYNKPPQEGLYRHFEQIAEASSKPVILYNVPARTITDLDDQTLARLAAHPRIAGIKDATGDLARLARQRDDIDRSDFTYLSGDDATACSYVLAGGDGVISVTANIAPKMNSRMISAAREGQQSEAEKLNQRLEAFNRLQGVQANPIPVKWALHKTGRIAAGIRLPLLPLASEHHSEVLEAVKELH